MKPGAALETWRNCVSTGKNKKKKKKRTEATDLMEIRETGARRFRIDIHFLTMERNASEVIEFRDILKHRSG